MMRYTRRFAIGRSVANVWIGLIVGLTALHVAAAEPVKVGSKRFTESYILGEIVSQTLNAQGVAAEHRQGLGNTGILERALASGSIDVYPEYTGTIVRELLKREGNPGLAELNAWLAPRGLKAAVPFGFNNTYALAMLESRAQALGIRNDLRPAAAAHRRRCASACRTSSCSAPMAGRR